MSALNLSGAELTNNNIEQYWLGGKTARDQDKRIQGTNLPNTEGGKRNMAIFVHYEVSLAIEGSVGC